MCSDCRNASRAARAVPEHLNHSRKSPGNSGEMHFPGANFLAPTKRNVSSGKCDVSPIGAPVQTSIPAGTTRAATERGYVLILSRLPIFAESDIFGRPASQLPSRGPTETLPLAYRRAGNCRFSLTITSMRRTIMGNIWPRSPGYETCTGQVACFRRRRRSRGLRCSIVDPALQIEE